MAASTKNISTSDIKEREEKLRRQVYDVVFCELYTSPCDDVFWEINTNLSSRIFSSPFFPIFEIPTPSTL